MLTWWPSLGLLLLLAVLWLECRILAGRVSISAPRFFLFFYFGCLGSSLLSLFLQNLPFFQLAAEQNAHYDWVYPTTWLAGPPIEELSKALPVLVLAFLLSTGRRLTVADLTLAGFTTGLGFGFVEANFRLVASGAAPSVSNLWTLGYEQETRWGDATYTIYTAGHHVSAALVGLAAGIGLRLWPRRRWLASIPAVLMLALVTFDHSMWNWKLQHMSTLGGVFLEAPKLIERFYSLTQHGFIEILLLPLGLVLASWWEGRWCWRAIKERADLFLPGEIKPYVLGEWAIAFSRLPFGPRTVFRTLSFFLHRRAYALAAAQVARFPAGAEHPVDTAYLGQRVAQECKLVAAPERSPWFPGHGKGRRFGAWLRQHSVLLLMQLGIVLFFLVRRSSLPSWFADFLYSDLFGKFILITALGYVLWRLYSFYRQPRPDSARSSGETLAVFHTGWMLMGAAVVSIFLPLLAWLLGKPALLAGLTNISSAEQYWRQNGGDLPTTISTGGGGVPPGPREKDKGRTKPEVEPEEKEEGEVDDQQVLFGHARDIPKPSPEPPKEESEAPPKRDILNESLGGDDKVF